jgi:hypothetical protein
MEHWAKLSESHILRLGELTKREIQVICYLFLRRNGTNQRCNPKRKTIAAGTGVGRSHVTESLAGLMQKNWISEDPVTGNFDLREVADIPRPNVPKSGTKKFPNREQNPKNAVPKSGTKVPKLGKNSSQIGNAHIKDFKQTTKQTRTEKARAPKKPKEKPTRIPDPFPLTDEMISWFYSNVPTLRIGPIGAHDDFVEYWTNDRTKRATKTNWLMAWRKGMRLLLTWQDRDDAARGVPAGGSVDWRTVGKHSDDAPVEQIVFPDCFICDSGTVPDDPDSEYSTLHFLPCPVCRPEQYEKAKAYNDEFRRRLAAGLSLKNLKAA